MDARKTLIDNYEIIAAAVAQFGSIVKAWPSLSGLHDQMDVKTAKQYWPTLVIGYQAALDSFRQSEEKMRTDLIDMEKDRDRLQEEVSNLRQQLEAAQSHSMPERKGLRISGWSVRQSKDGYFRAYRQFKGVMKSVYLGRTTDGAEEKIEAWETANKE